jgi:hypothetical protein
MLVTLKTRPASERRCESKHEARIAANFARLPELLRNELSDREGWAQPPEGRKLLLSSPRCIGDWHIQESVMEFVAM